MSNKEVERDEIKDGTHELQDDEAEIVDEEEEEEEDLDIDFEDEENEKSIDEVESNEVV